VGQKSDTARTYITLYERYHFFGPPGMCWACWCDINMCTTETYRRGDIYERMQAKTSIPASSSHCNTELTVINEQW